MRQGIPLGETGFQMQDCVQIFLKVLVAYSGYYI